MNKNKVATSLFEDAVRTTPHVSTGYKSGLTALGSYSSKISVQDTTQLQGSIDIDECTRLIFPNSNRWDYAFAYKGEVYFVEIHGAMTSEVSVVMNKLQWLKDWLNEHASEISKLKAKEAFYWVQSKNFAILKNSSQYRLAVTKGLLPIPMLNLK